MYTLHTLTHTQKSAIHNRVFYLCMTPAHWALKYSVTFRSVWLKMHYPFICVDLCCDKVKRVFKILCLSKNYDQNIGERQRIEFYYATGSGDNSMQYKITLCFTVWKPTNTCNHHVHLPDYFIQKLSLPHYFHPRCIFVCVHAKCKYTKWRAKKKPTHR